MNDIDILACDIQNAYLTLKLTIVEYSIISDQGGRVNPVMIELWKSLWTNAEALMSKCVEITDEPSGGRIIKCELFNSKSFEV